MATVRKFKKQFLQDLLHEELDESVDVEIIQDEITDNSRWSIQHSLVFRFEDKFYETWYQVGATEYQDESPWEYAPDEVDCTEVAPKEVVVIQYLPV